MKSLLRLAAAVFSLLPAAAAAQTSKEGADAQKLFYQANTNPTLRATLAAQTTGFLGDATFQPGALRTFDGRRRPLPGLRYHPGQHVLQAQDSLDVEKTQLWPLGSLRGFDIGTEETAPRRFRPRLVREGALGSRREFVEVLTTLEGGPLLLAWVYVPAPADAGSSTPVPVLVVGPGFGLNNDPLRPLELSETAVLKLFGARAAEVRAYAFAEKLRYDEPADVARMVDHFNRVAVMILK